MKENLQMVSTVPQGVDLVVERPLGVVDVGYFSPFPCTCFNLGSNFHTGSHLEGFTGELDSEPLNSSTKF